MTRHAIRLSVLVGVKAEPTGTGNVKVHLDVVFQSAALERPLGKGYWYLACTGSDIELQAKNATIVRHSGDKKVEVKCKVNRGKEREFNAKITVRH
jgi:hypothetical protein